MTQFDGQQRCANLAFESVARGLLSTKPVRYCARTTKDELSDGVAFLILMSETFRDLYCARRGRPVEKFAPDLFPRAIHRRSLPLTLLVWWFNPKFFKAEFDLLRELAVVTTREAFRKEVEEYRYDVRRQAGWLKNTLRLRISGQRLLRYARLLPR